jgi:hypothetical protein
MANLSSLLASNFEGRQSTVSVGTTTAVNPNVNPSVANSGTSQNLIADFSLPRAPTLAFGTATVVNPNVNPSVSTSTSNGDVTFNLSLPSAASVTLGTVTAVNANVSPSISNVGTNGNVVLNFSVPNAAAISLGATTALNPNQTPTLTNSGTNGNVVLNFGIPSAASVSVGTITALDPDTNPTVTNSGTNGNVVLDIGIPRARNVSSTTVVDPNVNPTVTEDGEGDFIFNLPRAATVTVGTVTTGAAGGSASVSNVGTNGDTVLNFTIPEGARGVTPRGLWSAGTTYAINDLAYYNGSTYRRLTNGVTSNNPAADATNWEIFAQSGISPTAVVIDELTNLFNGQKTVFDINFNGTPVSIGQIQDLQVVIDGRVLIPDTKTTQTSYPWMVVSTFGSLGKGYRLYNDKLVLYNAPKAGQSSYIVYRQTQLSQQSVSRYPFAATTIALGD